jgi:RNA polymerase sporulation-specific sigma factor
MDNFNDNLYLVELVFNSRFKRYRYLKDDLFQEGYIALFKSCKSSRENIKKYAVKAIYNNMLAYVLYKENKHSKYCETFSELENKKFDIESVEDNSYEDNFNIDILKNKILNSRETDRNSKIITTYIFDGLTQAQISSKFNLNQSQISRINTRFKNKIKEEII